MTTTQSQSPVDDGPLTTLSKKQQRIYEYLDTHADSETYFKSREIGESIGLTAREVGTNMPALIDADLPLTIDKWGYSSSTTWMVNRE